MISSLGWLFLIIGHSAFRKNWEMINRVNIGVGGILEKVM